MSQEVEVKCRKEVDHTKLVGQKLVILHITLVGHLKSVMFKDFEHNSKITLNRGICHLYENLS